MNQKAILIRASARFLRQHSGVPQERNVPAQPFPLTWNVDVLAHGRSQCLVIASEECSLFSALISVSRAVHPDAFLIPFRERLTRLCGNIYPAAAGVAFSNRTNRRVIGSQNDLIYLTQQALKDAEKSASTDALKEIEAWLNSTPMSYLGMGCPKDAWAERVKQLKQCGD